MALALSPHKPASEATAHAVGRPGRVVRPANRDRQTITQGRPSAATPAMRLSVECRTRRNQQVQAKYEAEARAQQRAVYVRRRLVAAVLGIMIAAAACLGVRAMASRGDGAASLPTVTPNGSAVLVSVQGSDGEQVDLSGAFVRGEQVYIVQPGDTLWSIASSLTDGNIRGFVSDLIALNGSASIDVGQRLVLPAL